MPTVCKGLPWWLVVKKPPANVGDMGLIHGLRRSPGEGTGHPLQCSCLGNPMDTGAWWAAIHGGTQDGTWASDYTTCMQDGGSGSAPHYAEGVGRGTEAGESRLGGGHISNAALWEDPARLRPYVTGWLPRGRYWGWVMPTSVPLQGGRVKSPLSWRWGGPEGRGACWQASPGGGGSQGKCHQGTLSCVFLRTVLISTSMKEAGGRLWGECSPKTQVQFPKWVWELKHDFQALRNLTT